MQYPSLTRSSVRHIELVPMGADRLMVVLIVNTGRVEQRVIETRRRPVDAGRRAARRAIRAAVNAEAVGRRLDRRGRAPAALPTQFEPADRDLGARRGRARSTTPWSRSARSGWSSPAPPTSRASAPTSRSPSAPVLEALEEHVVLLKLLGTARDSDTVAVRIGHENPYAGLQTTSVVSTEYGTGLRPRRRSRRPRPDPDGLPHDDGVGAGRAALRLPNPRQ